MSEYQSFLESKRLVDLPTGLQTNGDSISSVLFEFQRAVTAWAIRRGRAAIFADTGLGKTFMQVEWARYVSDMTGKPVLIFAPLCVSQQTVLEAEKLKRRVRYVRQQPEAPAGIYITNYEMLEHFDPSSFGGMVLDESSILKSLDGKTRRALIEAGRNVPFRLSCTATPSPNDYMEFGGQAEFLGVMSHAEMLATFFIHDGGDTSKWRLKGHGRSKFWEWVSSWAAYIKKPSDLGFSDEGYDLPPPEFFEHTVAGEKAAEGMLFAVEAATLHERIGARRASVEDRSAKCAEIVNADKSQWIVWCNLNDESRTLERLIDGAVAVEGSQSFDEKERRLMGFANGSIRVLVTKPSIAGFGLNWQHCSRMAFVGLSDSYEQFYQAMRRCWRFGQTKTVQVHIITAETEGQVLQNIHRKEKQADQMAAEMAKHMKDLTRRHVMGQERESNEYERDLATGKGWTLHLADCVELAKELEPNSIGYTLFSPPFSSLYTYSNSERDMGNTSDHETFYRHFKFLAKELYRATMPGRLLSFHCFQIPMMKYRDGQIGLYDFRGDMIRVMQDAGFIYHAEVCIWKDPVTQMQRTKALGLLHKTIRTDSSMSRQGLADYVVTMRKPGENAKPISHDPKDFPVDLWQRYASPVWMDIDPGKTLNREGARDSDDEKHIAPLQLDVIERCIMLWSAPDDLVFSPFAGIGSEGYMALKMGRRFIGSELKRSYFDLACENLDKALGIQLDLLAGEA